MQRLVNGVRGTKGATPPFCHLGYSYIDRCPLGNRISYKRMPRDVKLKKTTLGRLQSDLHQPR
jgi:hypothetical protein